MRFAPTADQMEAIDTLSRFIIRFREKVGFVLSGYAGTGKTTLISALTKALPQLNIQTVLLAPTGRASKVMSLYAAREAFTIHKYIYYNGLDESGFLRTSLRKNKHAQTLFIVDEASMLCDDEGLLSDLMSFVYSGRCCRVLFVGDVAQLPPVGSSFSPALEAEVLQRRYAAFGVDFLEAHLTEVLRQAADSLILSNATSLRERLYEEDFSLPIFDLVSSIKNDLIFLKNEDFEDTLQGVYGSLPREEVVFITRSNKRANMFNQSLRARVFGLEEEIAAGDLLMVVRNNYHWTENMAKIGFLANGDMMEILKVRQHQELYGLRFADIEARLTDYPDEPPLELKICLDALHVNGPSLDYTQQKQLWEAVMQDYAHIKNKGQRMAAVKKDPYLNAVQVKYAYALTCHKTQGGQWPTVFVDLGYFTDDMLDADFFRWLYTALTRAVDRLYLVGFDDKWFN